MHPIASETQIILTKNISVLKCGGMDNSSPSTAKPDHSFKLNYIISFFKIVLLYANHAWFPPAGM